MNESANPSFLEMMKEGLQRMGARIGLVSAERVGGILYLVDEIRGGHALLNVSGRHASSVVLYEGVVGSTLTDNFQAMRALSEAHGNRVVVANLNGSIVATDHVSYSTERLQEMHRAGHKTLEAAIDAMEDAIRPRLDGPENGSSRFASRLGLRAFGPAGQLAATALSLGAASVEGRNKMAVVQSEHPDLILSPDAIAAYHAIARDARLESSASMGIHQAIGLRRFLQWGQENGIPQEIMDKLNPTSLPLNLRPTASIPLPTQIALSVAAPEHSFESGPNISRNMTTSNLPDGVSIT